MSWDTNTYAPHKLTMGDPGRIFTYTPTYNPFVYQYVWKKILPFTGHIDVFKGVQDGRRKIGHDPQLFFVVY
jgi:hypothetical protein